MRSTRFDLLAVAAAVVAVLMLCVYVSLMRQQDDQPLVWFVAGLVAGAVAAAYGAVRGAPHRHPALLAAAVVLGGLGILGLLTIGLPILLAAVCCLVAGLGARRVPESER